MTIITVNLFTESDLGPWSSNVIVIVPFSELNYIKFTFLQIIFNILPTQFKR